MLQKFSGLKGLSAFKYTAISGAATTLVVTYTCVAFFNFVFTSYTYGNYPWNIIATVLICVADQNKIWFLAKFRREVNPDMPEQLYINNLCDTNRNLSFYKEYVHERSEILCGLSVTCINLFNGIILLLACCLDCKESFYNFGPWKPRQLGLIATSSVRVRPTVSRCGEFESVQSLSVGG